MKKQLILIFLTLAAIFLASAHLAAQDTIIKKDGTKLKVVIKEMSDTEIKYVDYRDVEGIVFTMDRALIREIKFSYGKKIKEEGPNRDAAYYVDDRMNNVKLNFTAIGAGFTILTYERAIDLSSSFEVSLKFPGLGVLEDGEEMSGFGADVGYKLKLGSVFKKDGYRPKHLMAGGYVRARAGYLNSDYGYELSFGKNSQSIGYIGLDFGKQWVVSNRAVIDLFIGYHYYFGKNKYSRDTGSGVNDIFYDDEFRGGDLLGTNNNALAFGIRIGGLFEKYGTRGKKK